MIPIYIGYDIEEHDAYCVARHTILKHTPNASVTPLVQDDLRHMGLYRRSSYIDPAGVIRDSEDDRPFSTAFTFTRFLVPFLMARRGWAIFMDLDMLVREDMNTLWEMRDDKYALMCVKHFQKIKEGETKMMGQVQEGYDRKNWSSLVLWNCGHPDHRNLSLDDVNTKPGRWLHNFHWLTNTSPPEGNIGKLPEVWNWLEGYSSDQLNPAIVHFTRGGPWFEEWQNVAFADEWRHNMAEINEADRERL